MAIDKRFECPDCGQMVFKLWDHKCPGGKVKITIWQEKEAEAKKPRPPLLLNQKPVVSRPKRKEKPSTERTRRYRERHGEAYKEQRKVYMRKWRAQPDDRAE